MNRMPTSDPPHVMPDGSAAFCLAALRAASIDDASAQTGVDSYGVRLLSHHVQGSGAGG